MMNLSELLRRLNNLISIGTISETKSAQGKALARVKIFDRVTDFYPVVSFSNTFKRHFIPMRVNEQVLVFSVFGDASSGFIIRGIFNRSCKEPNGSSQTCEVMEYEDGTVISYDTAAKELKVNASDKITIICKAATVKADTVDVTATTSNTGDVTINGNLTVSNLITGKGGLAISGGSGASVDGDISTTGHISDSKGDLTCHGHNDSDGGTSNAR